MKLTGQRAKARDADAMKRHGSVLLRLIFPLHLNPSRPIATTAQQKDIASKMSTITAANSKMEEASWPVENFSLGLGNWFPFEFSADTGIGTITK
mmetsp:Transcript_22769/g.33043  ORF Transcript_22769/g.33043 Transcript_22769/m.33043 type:complete len:95 (+) Transcript_22769:728-1012(+)